MITPGLEKLIQQGKAQAHTFTFGGGAVGRIPLPENTFIIIHHFDYFHFIDLPDSQANSPAIGSNTISGDVTGLVLVAHFDIPGVGSFDANIDFNDPAGTLAGIVALLAIVAPGWSVTLFVVSPGIKWTLTWTTTSPGVIYNGISISITPVPPNPAFIDFPKPFAGGASVVVTHQQFLRHATHQLEFRSTKSRNHYVIQEPIVIFPLQATPPPYQGENTDIFFAYMNGVCYKKDCYLVHDAHVDINILGVPPTSQWGVTFAAPDNLKSQEFPKPVGYGQAGTPSEPTTREIIFDAAGNTQQYLPLTSLFDITALIPGEYREQFKVDVNALNALQNPQNKGGIYGNFPTYPLINIDYIQVSGNYNEFVKSSNG